MIVEKQTFTDPDGSVGYIESIYDSSNLLKSIYFPKTNILYLSFKRGGTYKYYNVNEDVYNNFEKADSQGKFFINEIKNNDNYPYTKEFTLKEYELINAKSVIKEWKEKNEQTKN